MFCVSRMPRAISETHFGDLSISIPDTLGCKVRLLRSCFAVPAEPLCSRTALLGTRRGDGHTSDLPSPSAPAATGSTLGDLCFASSHWQARLHYQQNSSQLLLILCFLLLIRLLLSHGSRRRRGGNEIKMRTDRLAFLLHPFPLQQDGELLSADISLDQP